MGADIGLGAGFKIGTGVVVPFGVFCLRIVVEMSYSLAEFADGAAWARDGSWDLEIGLGLGFWLGGKSSLGLGLDWGLVLCFGFGLS